MWGGAHYWTRTRLVDVERERLRDLQVKADDRRRHRAMSIDRRAVADLDKIVRGIRAIDKQLQRKSMPKDERAKLTRQSAKLMRDWNRVNRVLKNALKSSE